MGTITKNRSVFDLILFVVRSDMYAIVSIATLVVVLLSVVISLRFRLRIYACDMHYG